jgi:hypothetical protein
MSVLYLSRRGRLLHVPVSCVIALVTIGAITMGLGAIWNKLATRKASQAVSPARAGYAPTTLSAAGAQKFAQVTDPNSTVGKPTRPAQSAAKRETIHT